jgi:RNase adaptor protein for sRNA GlmZ degradation
MNELAILVVTGASGVGKTSAVRSLESRRRAEVRCFYFDEIGVPSIETMESEFGESERWQARATRQWISRLAIDDLRGYVSVLDGQTRPSFVRSAAARFPSVHFRIVLLDCDSVVRRARVGERGQPELATAQMDAWSAYLRGQADALELPVLDTTRLTIQEVTNALEAQVDAFRQEIGIVRGK